MSVPCAPHRGQVNATTASMSAGSEAPSTAEGMDQASDNPDESSGGYVGLGKQGVVTSDYPLTLLTSASASKKASIARTAQPGWKVSPSRRSPMAHFVPHRARASTAGPSSSPASVSA